MRFVKVFTALALCAGCTLSTDAGDREIAERLDLDFTLRAMSPHRGEQLDVALVTPLVQGAPIAGPNDTASATRRYTLQARARVLVPTDSSESLFPAMNVRLRRAVQDDGPLQVLFYVDTLLNNNVEPFGEGGLRAEHTWIRNLAPSAELTFYHEANFQNYFDSEITPLGGDIDLDVPEAARTDAHRACLGQKLALIMKKTFEVWIVFNPSMSPSDKGYFKMHADNQVPNLPIKLEGIADSGSSYGIEIVVDGVRSAKSSSSAAATQAGLTIPFEQWFALDNAEIAACLAL